MSPFRKIKPLKSAKILREWKKAFSLYFSEDILFFQKHFGVVIFGNTF